MATRRMLHNKISISLQVGRLSLEAQLLFTWLISHADDEGRLKGEPEYIKATVVPLKEDWTFKDVAMYLDEIKKQGLIYYWQDSDRMVIQFIKWDEHQLIRGDRFKPSLLPSYQEGQDNHVATNRQPIDNQPTAQAKVNKVNENEIENSEANHIAVKSMNSIKEIINKKTSVKVENVGFNNRHEVAALQAWQRLEPQNKMALQTTYLNAVRKGVKADTIYRFVSEIKQDRTIKNPGKIFNKKVEDYCKLKEDDKS